MVIKQGDVFWIDFPKAKGSESAYRHPHVVVQNNIFNSSSIHTVVLCALTSNCKRASSPGNVALRKGEANLPKRSVVNITQIVTLNKFELKDKIGTLSKKRINEIREGIKLLIEPKEII